MNQYWFTLGLVLFILAHQDALLYRRNGRHETPTFFFPSAAPGGILGGFLPSHTKLFPGEHRTSCVHLLCWRFCSRWEYYARHLCPPLCCHWNAHSRGGPGSQLLLHRLDARFVFAFLFTIHTNIFENSIWTFKWLCSYLLIIISGTPVTLKNQHQMP